MIIGMYLVMSIQYCAAMQNNILADCFEQKNEEVHSSYQFVLLNSNNINDFVCKLEWGAFDLCTRVIWEGKKVILMQDTEGKMLKFFILRSLTPHCIDIDPQCAPIRSDELSKFFLNKLKNWDGQPRILRTLVLPSDHELKNFLKDLGFLEKEKLPSGYHLYTCPIRR